MVTKNTQNVHRKYFWPIVMTFMCDVKIDINICEPRCVFFCLFDILTHDVHHLSLSQDYFYL